MKNVTKLISYKLAYADQDHHTIKLGAKNCILYGLIFCYSSYTSVSMAQSTFHVIGMSMKMDLEIPMENFGSVSCKHARNN